MVIWIFVLRDGENMLKSIDMQNIIKIEEDDSATIMEICEEDFSTGDRDCKSPLIKLDLAENEIIST